MSSSPSQQTPTTVSPWWSRPCRIGWNMFRIFWGTIVLGLVLNTLVSLAFLSRGTSLQTLYFWPVLEWIQQHLFQTGLIILVLFGLTGLTRYGSRREETAPREKTSVRTPTERDRAAVLRLLENEYSRQLTQSLQGATMMELGLQERTDVISSPAQLVSWRLDVTKKRSYLLHTSIVKAYDEASAGLLILGAPGAGKSTLLRELACELVNRAEKDTDQPIPVLVNLSSWATKKLPLETWLVEQLQVVYALPHHLSKNWIGRDQFLFLLDGLDEVAASDRSTCIEYINVYRRAHFVPLVVCSRSQEYLAQVQRLKLPYAVEVQPLVPERVDDYVKRIGKPLAGVRSALRSNSVLHDLVTTPLMLSVVILAYRDRTAKDLPHIGTPEEQQRQVFEHYVKYMLEQNSRSWRYSAEQTRKWLIFLAKEMSRRQLTDFYVESLQRDWLPIQLLRTLYPWMIGLFFGLVFGLSLTLVFERIFGLVVGLVFGLSGGFVFGRIFGQSYKLIGGLQGGNIAPVDRIKWSWRNILQPRIGPFNWLFFGLIVGLSIGLVVGLAGGGVVGLVGALISALVLVLVGGFAPMQFNESMRLESIQGNQGIYTSGRNALRVGLFSWLVLGSSFGLVNALVSGAVGGLVEWLVGGVIFGLYFGLIGGGSAYINHYILRFFLWRSNVMPWHYVLFLNEVTERILLQRVGGVYRFIHPLLQEYFASLSTVPPSNVVKPQTSQHI